MCPLTGLLNMMNNLYISFAQSLSLSITESYPPLFFLPSPLLTSFSSRPSLLIFLFLFYSPLSPLFALSILLSPLFGFLFSTPLFSPPPFSLFSPLLSHIFPFLLIITTILQTSHRIHSLTSFPSHTNLAFLYELPCFEISMLSPLCTQPVPSPLGYSPAI